MDISYFPGCTLKTKGINFEKTALAVLKVLGINAIELDKWYCCGAVYSLSSDNLMNQMGAIRTLIKAKETGRDKLLTLCSMCYNTLKRAAIKISSEPDSRDKINDFMYLEETDYNGTEVETVHMLNLLDDLGAEKIGAKIKKKVKGLKIAPYYGCLLLRPKEIAIDNTEKPGI
ncbi:MAG: heterodisulfide reductase, subunit B, partial [Actinomycetia bacterium]|nr:heterodisulfide reductase, subunit B [Actinomycetes bacterium]